MEELRVDMATKIFLLIFIVVLSYFFVSIILQPYFVREPLTMYEMMQRMMGFSQQTVLPNILALIIALAIGLFASLQLKTGPTRRVSAKDSRQRALYIVKKKLSDDEKRLLKEIEKAGAITQDSLRARLGWSKAKVSTTLTRLDKMNLIQRERQGKTYRVFLSKDLR